MDSLFNPEHIAIFGSFKENKLGYQLAESLVKGNFKGSISLISRSKTNIFNLPSYTSIDKVGDSINLGIVAVPKNYVYDVLNDCIKYNVESVVIITSGFSEIGDVESEKKLAESIKNSNIRVIGPNCAGIMNPYGSMYATIEVHTKPGDIGFITQSGAIGGAVAFWAYEKNIGFSKFASIGNRIDISEIELMQYYAKDDKTKVIAIYVESISDGRRFIDEARDISKVKPIIIIKAGKSKSGKRAASSHTGSMAGEDSIYSAAFEKAGIIRVAGIEEMFDAAAGLVQLESIQGNRVAIVTNSGGPGILTADKCEELDLEVPEPSYDLTKKIKPLLLPYASVRNPFDLTVEGTGDQYREVIKTVKEGYDSIIAINVPTPYLDSMELAKGIIEAKSETGMPISASFSGGEYVKDSVEYLKSKGIPVFETGERCAFAHNSSLRYMSYKKDLINIKYQKLSEIKKMNVPKEYIMSSGNIKLFDEHHSMEFIKNHGIKIPKGGFAKTIDEAVDLASDIGFPIVMKMVAKDVIHKSDIGGVYLNLLKEDDIVKAFHDAENKGKGKGFLGVSLYKMINYVNEMIVGAGIDFQFGPYIMFGMGGVFAEILHDVIIMIAPITTEEVIRKIKKLKGYNILAGARGQKPIDFKSLIQIIVSLSEIICSYPEIKEIDLNPVFALEDDAIVADARIILNY